MGREHRCCNAAVTTRFRGRHSPARSAENGYRKGPYIRGSANSRYGQDDGRRWNCARDEIGFGRLSAEGEIQPP